MKRTHDEKVLFFDRLYALDQEETEEEPDEAAVLLRASKRRAVEVVPETVRRKSLSMRLGVRRQSVEKLADEGPNKRPKDALDEAVIEAGKLKHLVLFKPSHSRIMQWALTFLLLQPLDSEEDDEALPSNGSDLQNSSDEERARRKKPRTTHPRKPLDQSAFSCMHSHTGGPRRTETNPNARTIEILQEMANYYDRIKDNWRTTAYRKAISTLRRQARQISTAEEATALPFIGRRLALKIEEIVTTDRLRRLEHAKLDPADHMLQRFLGIYGVGFAQASRWVQQGHRTLDDLVRHERLSPNQLRGVQHYDDFNTRIPRADVRALGAVVQQAARDIDPRMEVHIMGSYRRGASSCSDIDLLITRPFTSLAHLRTIVLDQLIPALSASGFLVATLAHPSRKSGTKWQGACVLPASSSSSTNNNNNKTTTATPRPIWRRIDLLIVPDTELGAAMIYFTGNDLFNRSLRLLARKKGMLLNQRGLFLRSGRDHHHHPNGATGPNTGRGGGTGAGASAAVETTSLLESRSERRIFDILQVPWREPAERNV